MSEVTSLITEEDKEVAKIIYDIAKDLRQNLVSTAAFKPIDWYKERLDRLTGAFMYVTSRFNQLHALRKNNCVSAFIQYQQDCTVAGDKFVVATAERIADNQIKEVYEAEKFFEGLREGSEQGVMTIKKNMDILSIELQREAR